MKFKICLLLIVAHLSITWDILVDSITKKTFSSKKFVYSKGDYEKLKNGIESIDLKKNSKPFRRTSARKFQNRIR